MKFSVLIPAYKSRFLHDAIVSVLSQTYHNFEIVIVDDCSPEDIKSIVDQFTDDRIRYYRNEINCGAENVVDNWNICLNYCTGDWVICMGDDDVLMPECLMVYSQLSASYPKVDLLHGRVRLIDENGQLIRILEERPQLESAYSHIIGRLSMRNQYIGDFCFRRTRLVQEGGFYKLPFAWGSDDISAFMCCSPYGVANTNIPVFCYRMNSFTISSSKNTEKKLVALNQEEQWLRAFVHKQCPSTELEREELKYLNNRIRKGIDLARYSTLENELCGSIWNLPRCIKIGRKQHVSTIVYFRIIANYLQKIIFS